MENNVLEIIWYDEQIVSIYFDMIRPVTITELS